MSIKDADIFICRKQTSGMLLNLLRTVWDQIF